MICQNKLGIRQSRLVKYLYGSTVANVNASLCGAVQGMENTFFSKENFMVDSTGYIVSQITIELI